MASTKKLLLKKKPPSLDMMARKKTLDQILAIWLAFPNLRLGQLIENARLTQDMGQTNKDLFFIEDNDLLSMMQRFAAATPKSKKK